MLYPSVYERNEKNYQQIAKMLQETNTNIEEIEKSIKAIFPKRKNTEEVDDLFLTAYRELKQKQQVNQSMKSLDIYMNYDQKKNGEVVKVVKPGKFKFFWSVDREKVSANATEKKKSSPPRVSI